MYQNLKFDDLQIITTLDETHQSTTKIFLAKFKKELVVCKAISKQYIKDSKKFQHLKNQKEALIYFTKIKNTHINQFLYSFADQQFVYLLLTPAFGLPLHKLIQMGGLLKPRAVSMIVTQIAWILKQFHENGYVYRDIKASNFLVDENGKVTMIDLGLCKKIQKQRTKTICGTTHAMPPELFNQKLNEGYSYEVDHYAFGVLIFQLLVGKPPFGYEPQNPNIKKDIINGINNEILQKIYDSDARNLISNLLKPRQTRLGRNGGFQQILNEPYFKKLNLNSIKFIYNGKGQLQKNNYDFEDHIVEIEDFGINLARYQEICPDDPFFKFN